MTRVNLKTPNHERNHKPFVDYLRHIAQKKDKNFIKNIYTVAEQVMDSMKL